MFAPLSITETDETSAIVQKPRALWLMARCTRYNIM